MDITPSKRSIFFPAGITAYSHEPYTKQGVLEYGGKYYVCGTGRQPLQRTKTEEVFIEDVKLFPQGYLALALYPDILTGEPSVLLMDAGGWTVDLMRLDNGKPNAATCRSLELGMIRCIDEAMEQVRRDTSLSVTAAQVERVLNGHSCSVAEAAQALIRRQGRSYTEHILSAAMEFGFDLKAMPVVILGGGAVVIERNLRPADGLCRAVALPGGRINAEGFERLLAQTSARVSAT